MSLDDNLRELSLSMPPTLEEESDSDGKAYNEIYLSPAQQLIYNFSARETYARCGRGFGKTSIMALIAASVVQTVERGLLLFCGSSVKQLYCRTMPSMVKAFEQILHWKEGIHFFRGHAPKSAGFPEPLSRPRSWENVIHFYDGSIIYLASLAVSGSTNGISSVGIILDEARYAPWAKFKEEVMPTLRGEVYDHPGWKASLNPRYLSLTVMSDAAISQRQALWEKERESCTDEINSQICKMLAELKVCPQLAQMPKFVEQLNYLRGKSKVFFNMSSVENVSILTEQYIRNMQRNLPPLMFNIQVMGQWRGAAKDGYYANFSIDTHGYYPNPSDEMNTVQSFNTKHKATIDIGGTTKKVDYVAPDMDALASINDCTMDADCLPGMPLRITLDTNKNVNCFCVAQQYKYQGIESIMILRSMYVLNERRLRELCLDFHKYYLPHRASCKDVILYFDSTSKQGAAYALEEAESSRYYNVIKDELEARGWKVVLVDMGAPMRHELKYQFVNDVLTGKKNVALRVNRLRNDYLIASLENSRITYGRNGIRKDKSIEKLRRASDLALEEADDRQMSDMSDAFDNMLIGCVLHPYNGRRQWGEGKFRRSHTGIRRAS